MSRKRLLPAERSEAITGYLFSAPFLLLFSLFTIVPIVLSLVISFTDFNMLQMPTFVGAENYTRLFFGDSVFLTAIGNTLLFAVVTGPLSYLLSFLVAWFINELRPGMRALVTLFFYAPSISGNMVLVWSVFFSGDSYGYLNSLLLRLNVIHTPIQWLQTPRYLVPILCIVVLYSSLGTSFLAFIAGFQGVDKSYYEAAAVDGIRNRWQELWYVTLPLMKPQLLFSAVMAITGSFGIGGVITSLAGYPTVNYSAHTIMHHLEDYGSTRYELGYASAIATFLCVLMIVCNRLIQRVLAKVGT